jgi:putative phosphonate transport system ATP-binding protein
MMPEYTPLLRATEISKRYGQQIALQKASFELWPGEVLAIVGESGSGKTTLLNTIAAKMANCKMCIT